MFRDYEIRYVAASVAVAWAVAILLAAYQIFVNRSDTALGTAVAVVAATATATGATVFVMATVEVFMVLYRRVNERLLADARKEGREEGQERNQKRWREWYASQPKEVRDQLSPPPEEER